MFPRVLYIRGSRTIRKVVAGAGGEFLSRRNFFRYQIPLGLIGVHEFFSFNFSLREYFFVLRPPPP